MPVSCARRKRLLSVRDRRPPYTFDLPYSREQNE